jgi:hypothetical protein
VVFDWEKDYLDPALRSQVENLKKEAFSNPTSPYTLLERAKVVWEWANRFSLTGEPLPVECSFFMASMFVGNNVGEFSVLRRDPEISSVDLDQMIREISLKEEYKGSIGKFVANKRHPLLVESLETIEQKFIVSKVPLIERAGLLIARNGFVDHGVPQNSDGQAENFVTITCSNEEARFVPQTIEMRGLRGGIRAPLPVLLFRLEGVTLEEGEEIVIKYGDKSQGSPGFRIQSTSTDAFRLPVYVDFDGSGNFITFNYPGFEVIGGLTKSVHAFLPAMAKVGETFDLVIRSEDKARNRASGPIPSYQVFLNDELIAILDSGTDAVSIVRDLKIEQEGTYRFKILSNNGFAVWSDPIWVKSEINERVYWGDLHGHCEFADGQGTPRAFFTFGRDDAQLDFLCLSEHDIFLDDYKWNHLQECLVQFEAKGSFIPLLAYEWTAPPKLGGHHNVYFRKGDSQIIGLHGATNLESLFDILRNSNSDQDVLVIPHAHQAGDWRRADPELVTGVEIASQHGSFEWFGKRYLEQGNQIGYVGGSDNHQGHPGYSSSSVNIVESKNGLTAAWASGLDSEKIFSAIRNRSVYATSGERVLLDFSINGSAMGGVLDTSVSRKIKAKVSGTSCLRLVEIRKGSQILKAISFAGSLGDSKILRIAFSSTSEVEGHDNPRGYIVWRGWIEFSREIIKSVDQTHLFNFHSEYARLDLENQRRVEFEVHTRGHKNVIFIETTDIDDSDLISIHLVETVEISDSRYIRARDTLPATELRFSVNELKSGVSSREIMVGTYRDCVDLEIVDQSAPLDIEFEFEDTEPLGESSEFYSLYVEQLDGAQAWSSAIRVSGLISQDHD